MQAERFTLLPGDCMDRLRDIPDASIDACVTDPPYGYAFMGAKWDHPDNIAFRWELWAEVKRVLKPGGHVLAASGTRTYHRLAVAIEEAEFEIRDMVSWLYGSGFPKSYDVAKGIEGKLTTGSSSWNDWYRLNGRDLDVGGGAVGTFHQKEAEHGNRPNDYGHRASKVLEPTTHEAANWQGWGTALKPACEPFVLARKPLIGTVAENVLAHGTGALNVDGCRVGTDEDCRRNAAGGDNGLSGTGTFKIRGRRAEDQPERSGRWPANVIHDGSDEVTGMFPGARSAGNYPSESEGTGRGVTYMPRKKQGQLYDDTGSAARFFYAAKASKRDRAGSKHPTVKPISLMRYLCRLITPPGGLVLDPFAGTGTTGEAALLEGFRAILIEREPEYQADIRRRMEREMPVQEVLL